MTCDLTDPATCPAHSTGSPRSFSTLHRPSTPSLSRPSAPASSTSCSCRPHRCSTPTPSTTGWPSRNLDVEKALAAAPIESTFLRPGSFAGNALAWSRAIKVRRRGKPAAPRLPHRPDPRGRRRVLTEAMMRSELYAVQAGAGHLQRADRAARSCDRAAHHRQCRQRRRVEKGDGRQHPGAVVGHPPRLVESNDGAWPRLPNS